MGRRAADGRPAADETPAELRELLRSLEGGFCAFCRAEADGGARFWFWYLNERYAESSTIARLRASHAFCARHTQELLEGAPPSTITTVYRYVLPHFVHAAGAVDRLPAPAAACPACAAERDSLGFRVFALLRHVDAPALRRALDRSRSPCLPHLLGFAGNLERGPLLHLLGELQSRLRQAAAGGLGDLLGWGGSQAAAPPSAGWQEVAGDGRPGLPTLDRLAGLLTAASCPACISASDAAAQYVAWLPGVIREEDRRQWADAIWLCRTHLWELARAGQPAAGQVLEEARAYWTARIGDALAILRSEPGRGGAYREITRSSRLRRLLSSPAREAREASARALATRPCPACQAGETARSRLAALLVAALRDPRTAERYQAGVGLCWHDLRRTLGLGPSPDVERVLRATMVARLSLLVWELEERSRRDAWQVRYERKGPEQGAWRRAVRQFSGGVGP